ncbi:MAG: hypothetical protein ACI4JD_06130 [Ruminococcus sp.]
MTDNPDNMNTENITEEETVDSAYENTEADTDISEYNEEGSSQGDKIIPDTAPYQINYDTYSDAYRCYQKLFVFPKNRIMQLILLILAVDFGCHGAVDPDNTLAFLLLALCVALIFVLWYNPRRMRRSVIDVIREIESDEYIFSMDDRKMTFRTVPPEYTQDVPDDELSDNPPTEIYYGKDIRVIEKYEFFLICRGKQVFFVLPKYALYDNQAEIIRSVFEEKLGKRFRCKF